MKRFEKCKRVLATLLVALMVLQQTSIMTLAEELQVETQAAQEEKAVEQEAKPETSAPETIKQTEAPKPTEAPTEAPKPTEAPATEPQVTEAPATEPQVTEAPATEPQITEAPATEPQVTEVPETETSEAVTEKKTEAEKESESTTEETKAATKDSFSGAVDNAAAKVTLSKGISEDAVFVAKQYGLDSDYVAKNVDAALGAWVEAHNLTVLDAAVYDMHFEEGGKEIAVKQNAKVSLTFNSPILTETGDAGVATDIYVLHVVNGKAKETGSVTRNGNDAVTAATINTDGFSPFVFVKAVSGDAVENMGDASVATGSSINDYITSVDITTSGLPLDRSNGKIEGKIKFEIPNANKDCESVYFDIPVEYLSLNGDDSGEIRDESKTVIGSYQLNKETGRVTLTFKEEWYKYHTNIKGFFNFSASVKTDKLDNKESFEVSFNDKNKYTFTVKPGNIDGWKNQSNFIQDENGDLFIDYEVGIKPDSDLTKFVFTDTLGSNLEYVKDSFTWTDGKDWKTCPISPEINGSSVTYRLDSIKKGEYRIKYRVKIKDKTATDKLINTANWTWNGNTEGVTKTTDKTIGKYSISKSGENFTGKTAKWTVKINKGDATTKSEMTNGTYVDTLPKEMLLDKDSLKIKDTVNNRELVKDVDYELDEADGTFTIKFKDVSANNVPSYEMTYTTSLSEGAVPKPGTKYENSGSFTPDGGGKKVDGKGESTYQKDTDNRITKSVDKDQIKYDENGDATAEWTIVIDPLEETLENVVVGDNLEQNGKKNTGILRSSIRVVSDEKEVQYTFEEEPELEGKDGYLTKFKIKLDGKFSEKIYITYSTKTFADKVSGIKTDIYNSAYTQGSNFDWKSAQDKFTFEKSTGAMTKKGEKDGQYFKWTVRMNMDPDHHEQAAKDYGENDTLSMTDVIPEGMHLVESGDKAPKYSYMWGGNEQPAAGAENVSWNYDAATRVLTASFKNFGKQFVNFVYWTEQNKNNENAEGDHVYTNNASYSDNGKKMDEVNASVETKGNTLSKTSAENTKDNIVRYTVDVNPECKILNGGENLTLEDIMPSNCSYVPKSLTFVEGADAVIEHSYENGALQVVLKDAAHVKLTYELAVYGKEGENIEVINEATLIGKREISSKDEKRVTIAKTTAGASGEVGEISLKKIDKKSEAALSGAKFILQKMKYDEGSGKFVTEGNAIEGTTNENGLVTFGEKFNADGQPGSASILYDTLYYYQETQAPNGYKMSDSEAEPHYFYIGGNSVTTLESRLLNAGISAEKKVFGTIVVSNTKLESVSTEIKIGKEVSGENYTADEDFQFKLTAENNAPMPESDTVTVKNGKEASFGTINYTEAGEYSYTIREIVPENRTPGMTYDETEHKVTVKVSGRDTLTAEVFYDGENTSLTVTNTYVQPKTDAEIKVGKEVSGENYTADEDFQFKLTAENNAPMPESDTVTVKNGKEASFGTINYTEEGTYRYVIKEIVPEKRIPGMTYDGAEHYVKVVVSGRDTLTAEVFYDGENTSLTVTNTYVQPKTDVEIKVEKEVSGENYTVDEDFQFTLTAKNNAPMPEKDTVAVKNGKEASFGKILYTSAGTYEYTVKETKGNVPGMTYDTKEHLVTVTVSGTDELTATVKYDEKADSLTVTNTYVQPKADGSIKVNKLVNGENYTADEDFQFKLTAEKDEPMPESDTVTVKNGKEASFGSINYTEAGEYSYTIREVVPENRTPGMTYDETEHKVTVKVSGRDTLTAEVFYDGENTSLTVTNTYVQPKTDAEIKVGKEVSGENYTADEDFQFKLTAKDDAPMPESDTVTVKNGKEASFGKILYTSAGTYEYNVKETKGNVPGMTYDAKEHLVTVTVSGTDELTATVKYDEKSDSLTVTNTYVQPKTDAEIKVGKEVSGENYTADEDFQFKLTAENNAPMPESDTVTVKNGKEASFGTINYTEAGEYSYTIREIVPENRTPGMTYDETEHKVTVKVSGRDTLTAEVFYDGENTSLIVTNTYVQPKTDAEIKIAKAVDGEGFNPDEEFEFVLTSEGETPMPEESSVKVKSGSEATFGNIEYTVTGTYEYIVKEKAGTTVGMNYDTSEHKITVTVEGTDILTATVKYEDENVDKLTVTNKYDGVSVKIRKVDVINSEELEGAHIQVLDQEGKVVDEWDSTKEDHEVEKLKPGVAYTLRETVAPDGYEVTNDTTFQLKEEGTIDTEKTTTTVKDGILLVEDKLTSVKINKVDLADGKLLEGAHLQILDQDGNVVDEWVSTKESHEVTGLKTGVTYTLHETTAPDGYDLTEDTTFVLKEDGTIDADKTTAASKDGVLLVEDTRTEETGKSIEVTKRLVTIMGQVLSAEDATYYVALYADEACTKRVSNVKALEFKNASSATVTFENLKEDMTYYVGECTQDGTSYSAGTTEDGVRYTVNFGDGNRVVIEKADGTKEVHFDNQFLSIPDGYNIEAYLSIIKKVVDVDGKAKESNETFYAGLFADKECTTLSDAVSENIIELNMNGLAETKVDVIVPLEPDAAVNLFVAEVDKDGNLVANDKNFAYEVQVSGGEVTLDAQNDTAEVTITNSETKEEESESETETTTKKTTKKTTTAAKTGDNTPIGALAGALAVSAAVIVVYFKRRRKNEE